MSQAPVVVEHAGVLVVRDDYFPGGTKARYIAEAFDDASVVVYASPCEGGAQVALAIAAKRLGKRAVIVCARRKVPHQRTLQALSHGAQVIEVPGMAMLNVVQARARELASREKWKLAPFGLALPSAEQRIADAATSTQLAPDEVWCASGSGLLARGLARAWPNARRHVLQVGHKLSTHEVSGATIHISEKKYRVSIENHDFPSDGHYEAKAWKLCKAEHGPGVVVFWNVIGPPVLVQEK